MTKGVVTIGLPFKETITVQAIPEVFVTSTSPLMIRLGGVTKPDGMNMVECPLTISLTVPKYPEIKD